MQLVNKVNLEKYRKPALIVMGLLIFYALVGFFVLPAVIKAQLPKILKEQIARESAITDVSFNPFTLELSVHGFDVFEKDNSKLAAFETFYVNYGFISSITGLVLTFDHFHLVKPYIRIAKNADGEMNISDLIAGNEQPDAKNEDEDNEIFPIKVAELRINEGEFLWIDRFLEEPVEKKVFPINLKLDQFTTTLNDAGDLGFSLDLDSGTHFSWVGEIGVNPLFSTGHIELSNLHANDIWKLYLQDKVNFVFKDGQISLAAGYDLAYENNILKLDINEGKFKIDELLLNEKEAEKEIIKIPEFALDGIEFKLQDQHLKIASLSSRLATVQGWINQQGILNFQSLLKSEKTNNKSTATVQEETKTVNKPWLVDIQKLQIENYSFKFTDYSMHETVVVDVSPFNLELADYQLSYSEEKLQVQGKEGGLDVNNIILSTPKETQPLLTIPTFSVRGADFNLSEKQANIISVSSSNGQLRAWLNRNGKLNYQELFRPKTVADARAKQPQQTAISKTDSEQWQVKVDQVALENYTVNFKDLTTKKPVKIDLAPINFTLDNYTNLQGAKLPVDLQMGVNGKGSVQVKGSTVLQPLASNLDVSMRKVHLRAFQPYVNQFVKINFVKGNINVKGKVDISQPEAKPLALKFKGHSNIARLHTRDQIQNKDFVKWRDLRLKNIAFNLQPVRLTVSNILFKQPYAKITIREDSSINVNDLIVADTQSKVDKKTAKQKAKASAKQTQAYYKIGQINVERGYSDFSDFSLFLPFVAKLNDLNGTVKGISSNQKAKTGLKLQGKVYDLSPVTIEGEFSPDLSLLDIALHFKSMPLPFMTPYMADFAGYKIEKGKLSLDLMYKINDRQLTAENNLLIDQFILGEDVDNPDAVSLPLKLAIALMEDKDGKIKIDLPITGSLEDPEFSVAGLIFDAFVNLITKIVAAPFQAIASVMGSEEDFSTVSFQAGSAEVSEQELNKINLLTQALNDRPVLTLEIRGSAFEAQDWPEMREQALLEQLQNMRAEELRKEGEKLRAEYIELSEDEYQRLLAQLFLEKFPELGERSFFGTPKLIKPEMGEFYTVAKEKLAALIKPDQDKLFVLAAKRARNIARHVIQQGKIANDRIFILDGKISKDDIDGGIKTELSVNVS